jgi:hypothetical protein
MIESTDPQWAMATLVTVGVYTTPWEAQLGKARLETEGIDSVIADEFLGRLYCATAVGGVKLQVREEEAPRALELLGTRRPIPEIYLVTEADLPLPSRCPRCPSCNSDNLAVQRWSGLGFLGSWLLLGFPLPLPLPRRRWSCRGCGTAWKDGDLAGEEPSIEVLEEEDDLFPDLVTVGRFTTPWEAHLARTLLESEGIDACVLEERLPPVDLFRGQSLAFNRLEVQSGDAPRALAILARIDAPTLEGTVPAADS